MFHFLLNLYSTKNWTADVHYKLQYSMAPVIFPSTGAMYSSLKKRPWEMARNSNYSAREFQTNRTQLCLAWITWSGRY